MDGKCSEKITKEKDTKKAKRKKKAKKGIPNREVDGVMRTEFPWYHILAPLTLAVVTYKYSQPTLTTSVIMTFVLVMAALHS